MISTATRRIDDFFPLLHAISSRHHFCSLDHRRPPPRRTKGRIVREVLFPLIVKKEEKNKAKKYR